MMVRANGPGNRIVLLSLAILAAAAGADAQQVQVKSLLVDTVSGQGGAAALQSGDLKRFHEIEKLLVYQILSQLGISKESLPARVRAALDQPQTTSYEAFAAFSRGIDLADQGRFADARVAFAEAVSIDPSFALAQGLAESMPAQNMQTPAQLDRSVDNYNGRANQLAQQLAQTALANGGVPIAIVGSSDGAAGSGTGTALPPVLLDPCQIDARYCIRSNNTVDQTTRIAENDRIASAPLPSPVPTRPPGETPFPTSTPVPTPTPVPVTPSTPVPTPLPTPPVATPLPTPAPAAGPARNFTAFSLVVNGTTSGQAPSSTLLNPYITQTGVADLGTFSATQVLTNALVPPLVSPAPVPGVLQFVFNGEAGGTTNLSDGTPALIGSEEQGFPLLTNLINRSSVGPLDTYLHVGPANVLTDPSPTLVNIPSSGAQAANYLGEWYQLTFTNPQAVIGQNPQVNAVYSVDFAGNSVFGNTAFAVLASATPASVLAGLQSAAGLQTYTYDQPLLLQGAIALGLNGRGIVNGSGSPFLTYTQQIGSGNVSAQLQYGSGSLAITSLSISGTGVPAPAGPSQAFTFQLTSNQTTNVNADGSFAITNASGQFSGNAVINDTPFSYTTKPGTLKSVISGQIAGVRAGAVLGAFAAGADVINSSSITPASMTATGVFGATRR